jgi:hypothetical protein
MYVLTLFIIINKMKIINPTGIEFTLKELVWAKVKGYPWWPAEVTYA